MERKLYRSYELLCVNELRAGNVVWEVGNLQCFPMIISPKLLVDIEAGLIKVTSVVLTGKILKAAGFTHSGDYWFKDWCYVWEWGLKTFSYHSERIGTEQSVELASLHQLQNYYFAKVGKELEITLF